MIHSPSQGYPSSIDGMTTEEIVTELDKGYRDVLAGRTVPLDVVNEHMQRIMKARKGSLRIGGESVRADRSQS